MAKQLLWIPAKSPQEGSPRSFFERHPGASFPVFSLAELGSSHTAKIDRPLSQMMQKALEVKSMLGERLEFNHFDNGQHIKLIGCS